MVASDVRKLFLMVSVDGMSVAIPCCRVREILRMPSVVKMPQMPVYARGMANVRGSMIKVLDLRVLWDRISSLEELRNFTAMLAAREEDHLKWLAELEAAVREKREFRLARDPRQCAFGKWYYSYQTENYSLAFVLRRFEEPHARIHAIADQALRLASQGDFKGATGIIRQTRDFELKTLIELFGQTRQIVYDSLRELLVVLVDDGHPLGVAVDAVQMVESVQEEALAALPMAAEYRESQRFVSSSVKRPKSQEIAMLLDVPGLIERFSSESLFV